jgi:hypothetical protein
MKEFKFLGYCVKCEMMITNNDEENGVCKCPRCGCNEIKNQKEVKRVYLSKKDWLNDCYEAGVYEEEYSGGSEKEEVIETDEE